MLKSVYDWMGKQVYNPYANSVLGFLFYLEAIFFLPTDPMLMFYCIERPEKSYQYATIALIGSVLGGLTGYMIGFTLWHYAGNAIIHNPIINYFISADLFVTLCDRYKEHEVLAIFIAGFTPIPYKAATFTAGFCRLHIAPFIVASIIARGTRFFLLAGLIQLFGAQIKQYIDRYFNLLVLLVLIIIMFSIWLCT